MSDQFLRLKKKTINTMENSQAGRRRFDHLYPFAVVIEKSENPIMEFLAPKHATKWSHFSARKSDHTGIALVNISDVSPKNDSEGLVVETKNLKVVFRMNVTVWRKPLQAILLRLGRLMSVTFTSKSRVFQASG
ncbi:MAG TPA: hypothetical protein VGW77_26945 [Candidatus Binatia bacterium]|jgi:hypothetical protein|nr:hypothetical protein [Candidatus Binatia bacterium]